MRPLTRARKQRSEFSVEPAGEGRCTLRWRVAIEPSRIGAAGAPVNGLLFTSFFRDTARYFGAA